MSTKLVSYEHIPPGFEMVIEENEGLSEVKTVSHWFNLRLSDDPETWDDEIRAINEMQRRIGELSEEQRLIRAQMAEFCRRHPLFPQTIDVLCEEIGKGRFSRPIKMGCEGRGLLDSLDYHDTRSSKDQRRALFEMYSLSLKKWQTSGHPMRPTEFKILHFLGQPTKSKEAFVEKLIAAIDVDEPSLSDLKELCGDACRKIHGDSIFQASWIPFPFGCFKCQGGCPEGATLPVCPCCDGMIIDSGLLCVGKEGELRAMAGEFRHFIEENILAYAMAINSWLNGVPLRHATELNSDALEINRRIYPLLGDRDETKEWLGACLLKTIKDGKKHRPEDGVKRAELIDDVPQATSWFEGKVHQTSG